jgi:hypothetical protein
MSSWTTEMLQWADSTEVLFGIHAGLHPFKTIPGNYAGIAIYCEWEMTRQKWQLVSDGFLTLKSEAE